MKNTILIFLFFALLFVSPSLQAQSKVKVPEKLQGFWNWKVATSGDWDGTSIGADYVEYLYKIFYVNNIETQGADGYHLWLQNEVGEQIELTFSGLSNKQAKLQFSKWNEPKDCQLLNYPSNTEKILPDKLPKSLFQEWTSDNKGTLFCKFHDTNKLLYEDQEWDILSTGYYMEKEYRMLVRSGNRYKLIYLNNLSDESLRLACNMKPSQLSPIATNKNVYKILGNWIEKNNNRWELGFFEKFVIYKGDFWNYKSFVFKGETANILLTKGTKQLKLTLVLKSEVLCEVAIAGQQPKTYLKCGKNMPAYTTADATSFKDTRFQKTDTVTIKGYIRNNPFNKPFSIRIMDPISHANVELVFYADLDAFGRFTIKFPLVNTTQIFVDWGRMNKSDVAEPGETCFLFFDFSSGQHLIMGDNERLHNELAGYETYNPYRNFSVEDFKKRDGLAPLEFLTAQKDHLRKSNSDLNEHIVNNPNLSERFKYYQRNYYRFQTAFELMQRRFRLNRNEGERLPTGFMEYINDSLYQNTPVVPFTLVSDYLSFMRDYTGYARDANGTDISVSIIDGIRKLPKERSLKLTDEDIRIITKDEEFQKIYWKLVFEKADSTRISEAAKPYIEDIKKMQEIQQREEVKKFITNDWPKLSIELLNKKMLDAEFAVLELLVTDPQLKELLEVQKFYDLIYQDQKSLSDTVYQLFKERITSPALAAPIIKLQNHYTQLNKQDFFYAESLKKTDQLKESKDADILFAQLTAPYKGKVVYIDFWGTWCSPCKEQMKYVGAVKEAFKNKDVIFMYFANRSPGDSWANVIKEYHLSGPNAVHYRLTDQQQAMIERRFSVNSFPTYILMDKMGRIVNMKASRPEQKDQLVQEITNLLN